MKTESKTNTQLITKGIFALAAVAIIGTTTATYALTNKTSNDSTGYGTDGHSQRIVAASNNFNAAFASIQGTFERDIHGYVATVGAKIPGDASGKFSSSFDTASAQYTSSVEAAAATFQSTVDSAINSGESKDQFINTYNQAKATYLNAVDAAKNTFTAAVSSLGDNANQSKDQFIGSYNSRRDQYSNDLEGIKNTFADTVTNS